MTFDDNFVLQQLNSSSLISYAKFIRYGFPKSLTLQNLIDLCHPLENDLRNIQINRKVFYTKCLLSLGFTSKDFNVGNDRIFFRMNKFHLLDCLKDSTKNTLDVMKKAILRWEWRYAILCIRFMSK